MGEIRKGIPKFVRRKIFEEFHGKCMYCGRDVSGYFEIEHMHPVVQGGENDLDNLGLSCARCNALKGARTVDEFRHALISDVITKKNQILNKYLDERLESYLTPEQVDRVYELLVDLDMYLAQALKLKFYFERE